MAISGIIKANGEKTVTVENECRLLAQAEKETKPIGPISDKRSKGLSLEEAHTICEKNIQDRVKAGEKMAGYKIGFTNIPVRQKMGWPDSMYGHLMDSILLDSGIQVPMCDLISPKIECEICFRLGDNLRGKNLTVEAVLAATESVSASFEICDSRFSGWECTFPDIYADNGFACRVVLSGEWRSVDQMDLPGETVELFQDGKKIAEGQGKSAMEHPAKAVAWLAGKLADRDNGLKAGQLIMTGTLTPILPAENGSTYVADFSTLGKIEVSFD